MNFCTLFDSNYISKGLALYLSLRRTGAVFTLYVMAMDRRCQELLLALNLDGVEVECIEDIKDTRLWEARSNRSRAEFCWTCGSYVTWHFLTSRALEDIAYIDSDLMFFTSPEIIQAELGDASVGISPHFMDDDTFGKYCVQYVYFRADADGLKVLSWWKDSCLEWCYSKLEDGKYGDQKYLESFSGISDRVKEIRGRGCGIAYWNMYDNRYSQDRTIMNGDAEYPSVFFHYSGVNVRVDGDVLDFKHTFYLPSIIGTLFVKPYAELLAEVFNDYLGVLIKQIRIAPVSRPKNALKALGYFLRDSAALKAVRQLYVRLKYRTRKSPYSER